MKEKYLYYIQCVYHVTSLPDSIDLHQLLLANQKFWFFFILFCFITLLHFVCHSSTLMISFKQTKRRTNYTCRHSQIIWIKTHRTAELKPKNQNLCLFLFRYDDVTMDGWKMWKLANKNKKKQNLSQDETRMMFFPFYFFAQLLFYQKHKKKIEGETKLKLIVNKYNAHSWKHW